MATLSAGYYFGGTLADRKPEAGLVYDLILYAALYLIPVLIFYKKLLGELTGIGIIWGSILGTGLLFGPAMILLGMVSPFLIRLLAREDTVGVTTGKVFAISTWGSLLGTFLTSFVLIPELGSLKTLVGLIVALLVLYISGSVSMRKKIVGIGLIILALGMPDKKVRPNVVYETESAYNLIQVKKVQGQLELHLNDGYLYHSLYREGYISTGSYYDFMLLGTLLTNSRDILILGAGAGTSARQLLFIAPKSQIDAVEIDPKVIEIGHRYFGLPRKDNLKIFIEDARPYLTQTDKTYDLVEVDTFSGGPFIPFYLSTREFFSLVRRRLKPGGWMMMNVFAPGGNEKLSHNLGATVKAVFPSLFILELEDNLLFFAPRGAESLDEFKNKLKNQPVSNLTVLTKFALKHASEFKPRKDALILTDDRAPTEKLVYDMIEDEFRQPS